jgi:ACS family tartrate transporter-like MFS transporter
MSQPTDAISAKPLATYPADPGFEAAIWRKVARRLIPFIFVLYLVNILDRVNVGFASLQMQPELGLSDFVYSVASACIFYLGYVGFEVPSNLVLRRVGARRWIARIMVTWGLVSVAMMLVRGPIGFCVLRFLLGVAEAGFFPGMILYLTFWFPARERGRAVALFFAASPLAGAFGHPLSGGIMEFMDGVAGLGGWQWLFLIEGVPAILLGFLVLRWLTDRPEQASWLNSDERAWLVERMSKEDSGREQRHLGQAMKHPRVWLLCAVYFTVAVGSNGMGFYLPKILRETFTYANKFELGLLAALPYALAIAAMVPFSWHSDRTGERRGHVAVAAFVAAVGWGMAASFRSPWLIHLGLCIAAVGMFSMIPCFWSLPTAFLGSVAAAGGLALINSLGNLGGAASSLIMGNVKNAEGTFVTAMYVMAGAMLAGSLLVLYVRHDPAWERQ